jgi:hypothetical protein
MKKPPLGTGARFSALESKLAARPGVTNPGALAAAIGQAKYGASKMASMADHGDAHAATVSHVKGRQATHAKTTPGGGEGC